MIGHLDVWAIPLIMQGLFFTIAIYLNIHDEVFTDTPTNQRKLIRTMGAAIASLFGWVVYLAFR
jgi:hypothetical protein